MNIDEVHFGAPTTIEEENNPNFCDHLKKRNYNKIIDFMTFKPRFVRNLFGICSELSIF